MEQGKNKIAYNMQVIMVVLAEETTQGPQFVGIASYNKSTLVLFM